MSLFRETVKIAVPTGNQRGLNPNRARTIRCRLQDPRTVVRTVMLRSEQPIYEESGLKGE